MRTIKFNVYDTYLKQYICKGISLLGEAVMFGRIEQYCNENPNPNYKHSLQRFNDIVFLQFTGLLDKNGVEIYEGSLLKYSEDWSKTGVYEVKYSNDRCLAYHPINKQEDNYNYYFGNMRNTIAEIIGDIYTNPELL